MNRSRTNRVLQHLRLAGILAEDRPSLDSELLHQYAHDGKTDAFASLVERHGPMVWNVCSRMLKYRPDVEDAFQATFLILVQKAKSIKTPELLGNWLYGVAYHVARRLRLQTYKRDAKILPETNMDEIIQPDTPEGLGDVLPLLDQALNSLPEKYRIPIVLCDLQGIARRDVAEQLSLPEGTVASRHARGRVMLAEKLRKQGVTIAVGSLAGVLTQGVTSAKLPASVVLTTLQTIGQPSQTLNPSRIQELSNGVIQQMGFQKLKVLAFVGVALVITAVGAFSLNGSPEIIGQLTPEKTSPKIEPKPDPKKAEPKKEEVKNTLDPDVIKAWVDAGSIPGWMGSLRNGLIEFRDTPEGLTNPVPAFQFTTKSRFEFSKLPAPKSAFGLDFTSLPFLDRQMKDLIVFENIKHLELRGTLASSEVIKFAEKLPNLESLGLKGKNIREEDSALLTTFKKLRVLDVRDTPLLPKEFNALKKLDSLRVLALGGVKLDKGTWSALKDFKGLTHLVGEEIPTEILMWEHIATLKNLVSLEIDGGMKRKFDIEDRIVSLEEVVKLTELQSLVIRNMAIPLEGGAHLKQCKKLGHFEFTSFYSYSTNLPGYREAIKKRDILAKVILKDLDQIPNLQSLCLNLEVRPYVDTEELRRAPKLEVLDLTSTGPLVTMEALTQGGFPKLKHLTVSRYFPSNTEILNDMATLETVHVRLTLLSKDLAESMAKLKKLTRMTLSVSPEDDIQHLKKITQLRHLTISTTTQSVKFSEGKPLSDETLLELAALKDLESLDIDSNSVTDKGIEELRKALPKCRIRKY